MHSFSNADDRQGVVWNKLVESQCCLLSAVFTGGKKVQSSAKASFGTLLKDVSTE